MHNPRVFIWQGNRHGGAEAVMLDIAEFLRDHFNIHPTLGVFQGEKDRTLGFKQIEVRRVFPKRLTAYNIIGASLLLRRKLGEFNLVLTHSGGFWKRRDNFFVYREPADLDRMMEVLPVRSKIVNFLPYLVALYSLHTSDFPGAASLRAAKFFARHGVRRFYRTTNFLESQKLPILSLKIYRRDENFNVVFIGRDAKVKNLKTLLAAMGQLNDEAFRLHVFGVEGENTRNIIYHGWRPEKEVDDFLVNKAHLYVIPSRFEGISLSLLRALAFGVPSVCSPESLLLEYKETIPVFTNVTDLASRIRSAKQNYPAVSQKFFELAKQVRVNHNKSSVLKKEFDHILAEVSKF